MDLEPLKEIVRIARFLGIGALFVVLTVAVGLGVWAGVKLAEPRCPCGPECPCIKPESKPSKPRGSAPVGDAAPPAKDTP